MARVNVGINPLYLADQHLIAESVEITMIAGSLRLNNFKIKGNIPIQYKLGAGHINFFKPKLKYLARRLIEVNKEMMARRFNPGTDESYLQSPPEFQNDWQPTLEDSILVRNRIIEKMLFKPLGFWRYKQNKISNLLEIDIFKDNLLKSNLYFV